MENNEHELNPPKTVQELGIHFLYLRNDMKRFTDLVEGGTFAKTETIANMKLESDKTHLVLETRVQKLEDVWDKITSKIAVASVIMLVLMVLAMYGLDRFFKT